MRIKRANDLFQFRKFFRFGVIPTIAHYFAEQALIQHGVKRKK
jgi:hypothetical protein